MKMVTFKNVIQLTLGLHRFDLRGSTCAPFSPPINIVPVFLFYRSLKVEKFCIDQNSWYVNQNQSLSSSSIQTVSTSFPWVVIYQVLCFGVRAVHGTAWLGGWGALLVPPNPALFMGQPFFLPVSQDWAVVEEAGLEARYSR